MKNALLFILFLSIYIFLNTMIVYSKESINLNLSKSELAITFVDDNILVTNTENTLILLNDVSKSISKFGNVNILNANNTNKNFNYNKEYFLMKEQLIDNVLYKISENLIKIKYHDYSFCIYNKKKDNISNINDCNFLYLYDTKNINNIDIDEKLDIIFFNEKVNIPEYFIEDLYSKWIDIYKLKTQEYVVLKLEKEDYKIIVIPE